MREALEEQKGRGCEEARKVVRGLSQEQAQTRMEEVVVMVSMLQVEWFVLSPAPLPKIHTAPTTCPTASHLL